MAIQEGRPNYIGIRKELSRQVKEALSVPTFGGLNGLHQWWNDGLSKLPSIRMRKTDVADGEKNIARGVRFRRLEDGTTVTLVDSIDNGSFFRYQGKHAEKTFNDGRKIAWSQGVEANKATLVEMRVQRRTRRGITSVIEKKAVTGFVFGAYDANGNIAMVIDQEIGSLLPKKAVVRIPGQLSAGQYETLLAQKNQDINIHLATALPAFLNVDTLNLQELPDQFKEFLVSEKAEPIFLGNSDGNRMMTAPVLYLREITDPTIHEAITKGEVRWCTPEEVEAMTEAEMLNPHTQSVVNHVKARMRRK